MFCLALFWAVASSLDFRVLNTFPRDPQYTQGLEYLGDGVLLESNGLWGESNIRKTDLQTGRVLVEGPRIPREVFAEGATLHKGYIFQLTYKNRIIYVYDANTLRLVKTLTNPPFAEGWGLTTDGEYLIASDGTPTIYFLSTDNLELVLHHTISVNNNGLAKKGVNELAYINGIIYANVYPTTEMIFINAIDGNILGSLDLNRLFTLLPQTGLSAKRPEVINGVSAYVDGSLLVTGKNWPSIFQIAIIPAPPQLNWPITSAPPRAGKRKKIGKRLLVIG